MFFYVYICTHKYRYLIMLLKYKFISSRSKAEKACVKVMPTDRYLGYIVYMRSHVHPTIKDFNYRTVVEPSNLTDGVYTICFPDNAILKTGKIYVGLQPLEIMGRKFSYFIHRQLKDFFLI